MVPAANDRRDVGGARKTHARQRRQRFRIVFDTGEHQAARRGGERRFAFEELRIMLLHAAQMAQQLLLERHRVRVAHEARDVIEAVGRFGQAVGLAIVDHLQPVLELAQNAIRVGEIAIGLR